MPIADDLPLGKDTDYPPRYDPGLLRPIPRGDSRRAAGIPEPPPFDGIDIWTAYELMWLDTTGKPSAHVGELRFPATSPRFVESKSLKLYLYSLNDERHASAEDVREVIRRDLTSAAGADVHVTLFPVTHAPGRRLHTLPGRCIDGAKVQAPVAGLDPDLLRASIDEDNLVDETLHSHLFQTRCPVTNQPDWASVLIHYLGPKIDSRKLLSYLISYRGHQGFAEGSVERIFMDVCHHCRASKLTVHARFNRRGGLDINPFRSNFEAEAENLRLWRQ